MDSTFHTDLRTHNDTRLDRVERELASIRRDMHRAEMDQICWTAGMVVAVWWVVILVLLITRG